MGRALIRAVVTEARRQGAERITLRVLGHNTPARKLYERHGFAVVDEGADAWTMVASLS